MAIWRIFLGATKKNFFFRQRYISSYQKKKFLNKDKNIEIIKKIFLQLLI